MSCVFLRCCRRATWRITTPQARQPPRRTIADISTYLRSLVGTVKLLPAATDAPHVKLVQESVALPEETEDVLAEMGYKHRWALKQLTVIPELRELDPYIPVTERIALQASGPTLWIRLTRNEGLTLFADIQEESKRSWHTNLTEQRRKLQDAMKRMPKSVNQKTPAEVYSSSYMEFLDDRIQNSESTSYFTPSSKELFFLTFYKAEHPQEGIITLRLPFKFQSKSGKALFVNTFILEFHKDNGAQQFLRYFNAAVEENTRFWEVQSLTSWALGKRRREMGLLPAVGVRELAHDYAFKQISSGIYHRELFGEFDLSD